VSVRFISRSSQSERAIGVERGTPATLMMNPGSRGSPSSYLTQTEARLPVDASFVLADITAPIKVESR